MNVKHADMPFSVNVAGQSPFPTEGAGAGLINEFLLGDFQGSMHVQRARELVPVLKERAARQWTQPKVFDETIADMQRHGFFQMLQPRRWEGAESTPIESFEVAAVLAEADPSVAWVLGVVGIHAYHLAMFPDEAQRDVWKSDTTTLISSPYAPGKAVRVPGGFRLTGRWRFSSGSDHCAWTFLGANVEGEEDVEGKRISGMPAYTFLLPRSDYQIEPTWQVHGLRATGSNDIVVNDMFVPEHRTLAWADVINGTAPGLKQNTGLLYRLPFFQIFSRATTAPSALGGLKGMVNAFIEFNASRVSKHGVRVSTDPAATLAAARALSEIEEMKSTVYKNYARIINEAQGGTPVSMDERRMFRFQAAQIPSRCALLATELYRVTGGTAIFEDLPFGRYLNDIMAIQTHGLNNYQLHANAWVGTLMGNEGAAHNYVA
jgi:3-hydroxy-9,10-secoandrosta-1,3,5(10)-triene-9,17-dione monooxygenase